MSDPNSGGGVRVARGARGLSPNPEDEKLVRLNEALYQLPDGTVKPGLADDDTAFQVYPAGATITVGQARELGVGGDVDPGKLEERREQHADFMGGSAVVDAGAVSQVRVDGSTSAPLEGDSLVQTAEDVQRRVDEAVESHRTGEPTAEQREAAEASERESTESAEKQTAAQTAADRRAARQQAEADK